jgi:hypothetical protein
MQYIAMHVSFLVAETLVAIICTCKFSSAKVDIRENKSGYFPRFPMHGRPQPGLYQAKGV